MKIWCLNISSEFSNFFSSVNICVYFGENKNLQLKKKQMSSWKKNLQLEQKNLQLQKQKSTVIRHKGGQRVYYTVLGQKFDTFLFLNLKTNI
jgi:hypothetical protein